MTEKGLNLFKDELIKNFKDYKNEVKFRKAVENNLITIKNQITLIPMADKDFNLILRNKDKIAAISL